MLKYNIKPKNKDGFRLRERSCTVCGATQQMTIDKLPAQPTKPETPATGDNSHLGLWVAAALVAGAGLVGTVLYQRKKRS